MKAFVRSTHRMNGGGARLVATGVGTVGLVLVGSVVPAGLASAAPGGSGAGDHKTLICHYDRTTGTYSGNDVDLSSTRTGHDGHADDIIPALHGHAGLNWDAAGEAIWAAGCAVPGQGSGTEGESGTDEGSGSSDAGSSTDAGSGTDAGEPATGGSGPVDTTDPVVDQTDPVVDQTDPVVDQTDPVVDQTDPVVDQTVPVTPTDPVTPSNPVDPTGPVVDPTDPVDTTDPVVDPTGPVVDPTDPVVDPTGPVADPTDPVVDPTNPVVDPTDPVDTTDPVTSLIQQPDDAPSTPASPVGDPVVAAAPVRTLDWSSVGASLPRTGATPGGVLGLGLGFLVAGLAAVAGTRRRTSS